MNEVDIIADTYKHKHIVSMYMNTILKELMNRSLDHDNSKLDKYELEGYTEFIPKLKEVKYGSEEYEEILKQMKPIKDHHVENNRHHLFEREDNDMDLIDLIEMLVDWKAASINSDTSFEEGIEINQKRFGYSDEIKQLLINTTKYFT